MSWETFDENCDGCKPILVNPLTGIRMADDTPEMQATLKAFAELTLPEKQAWHRFTCLNSRTPEDLKVVALFSAKVTDAMDDLEA